MTCLLGRLNGNGVLLWDGDLHWFRGVVLPTVALEGSSKLVCGQRWNVSQTPVGRTMDATHLHHFARAVRAA